MIGRMLDMIRDGWGKIAVRWIGALFAICFIAVCVVFWWTAPEYLPGTVTFTDAAVDGVPVESSIFRVRAGQNFTFTCKGNPISQKFIVVDSAGAAYGAIDPSLPRPQAASDRFDPTFLICFASSLRLGRPSSFLVAPSIKTDSTGDSLELRRFLRAPSTPGQYEFQILWAYDPEGWVQTGPNSYRQKLPKNYSILWRQRVIVEPRT